MIVNGVLVILLLLQLLRTVHLVPFSVNFGSGGDNHERCRVYAVHHILHARIVVLFHRTEDYLFVMPGISAVTVCVCDAAVYLAEQSFGDFFRN